MSSIQTPGCAAPLLIFLMKPHFFMWTTILSILRASFFSVIFGLSYVPLVLRVRTFVHTICRISPFNGLYSRYSSASCFRVETAGRMCHSTELQQKIDSTVVTDSISQVIKYGPIPTAIEWSWLHMFKLQNLRSDKSCKGLDRICVCYQQCY